MRRELEDIADRLERMDYNNIYETFNDIKRALHEIIELLDKALPKDVSDDV